MKFNKTQFEEVITKLDSTDTLNSDYLFDIYDNAYDAVDSLLQQQTKGNVIIDNVELISYLIGEYVYAISPLSSDDVANMITSNAIKNSLTSVVADKYISLSLFNHEEQKFTNPYIPPISTLNLYINLMANFLTYLQKNDPKSSLLRDLFTKSISISKSIIHLLIDGYVTEAFAVWRTLHECECTLILIDKYKDVVINSYLKHMKYGLAYRNSLQNDEERDATFVEIKKEMGELGLKSKDMKKYIEYGWINAIYELENKEERKLNFRDGIESLAGLHSYSDVYIMSSEILHSTPLLIYSNKQYFYSITLINLYESFFRLEVIFEKLFNESVDLLGIQSYKQMKDLYYKQLINIHQRETIKFKDINKRDE